MNTRLIYFFALFFQPLIYVKYKKYKRGLTVQGLGIIGSLFGFNLMEKAFVVGNDTLVLLVTGFIVMIGVFCFTVYDCIRIISKAKHFVKA